MWLFVTPSKHGVIFAPPNLSHEHAVPMPLQDSEQYYQEIKQLERPYCDWKHQKLTEPKPRP